MRFVVASILLALTLEIALAQDEDEIVRRTIDYETLDHYVAIDSFRAGNHDPSGINDYYFVVTLRGLVNTPEERRKPIEERRQIVIPGSEHHPITLPSLKVWTPTAKEREERRYEVKGDLIREIVAKTMTEYGISESQVAVITEITLFEKAKTLGFFGEDLEVATSSYYTIPTTPFDAPPRTDLSLTLEDDKGTLVTISVTYAERDATAAN